MLRWLPVSIERRASGEIQEEEEETGSVAPSDTPKRETAKQWPDCFTTSDAMRGYGKKRDDGHGTASKTISHKVPAASQKAASHTLLPFCVCVCV